MDTKKQSISRDAAPDRKRRRRKPTDQDRLGNIVDWRHLLDVGDEAGWPADRVAVLSEN
jgi:hypothetical protein